MLKIVYLINHAGKGGSENYIYSLIERLHGKVAECYLIYNEDGLLVDRVKKLGVKTFNIKMRNPFDLKAAKALSSLCKELDVDVVHSHFLRENYIAVLSKLYNGKIKAIFTNHVPLHNNLPTRIFNSIFTFFNDGIIAVYNRGKDLLKSNWVYSKRMHVIFNSVDVDYWSNPEPSTIREELKINDDEFVISCMARFTEEKGQRFLIEALAKLKDIAPRKFKCILGGDGPLLAECKNLVKKYELEQHVMFIGYRQDTKNIYHGIDLYVSPSSNEAMSYSIIEVLACGVPVVATNVGGCTDIINHNTACGEIVEYGDIKALSDAIIKFMSDEDFYNSVKSKAVDVVRQNFNIDKMVKETYNLYIN